MKEADDPLFLLLDMRFARTVLFRRAGNGFSLLCGNPLPVRTIMAVSSVAFLFFRYKM